MTMAHPTETDESKDVDFCFHWNNNICSPKKRGKVTNCGEFFVYFLKHVPQHYRYCAEP
jgi:hypothetical protein